LRKVDRWYRFAHSLHGRGVPVLPKLISYAVRFVFGCWIPAQTEIGEGTVFGYGGLGVVVHGDTVIGRGCSIGQNVTIGGGRGGPSADGRSLPKLGDNVIVGAGAVILGAVEIGDDAIVGANAVVVTDIPPAMVFGGVPARPLRPRRENDIDAASVLGG
jgi:serine O-acetyltransferase